MNDHFDRLHADLADLADQVSVVDLRDRALGASRRLAVRRTVMSGVAALAVLAAGGGTAFAVLPQRHGGPLPAAIGSASPTPPASPSLDASPTTEGSSAPPATATSVAPSATIPGLYLLRIDDPQGTVKNDLWYRPGGGSWRVQSTVKVPPAAPPAGSPMPFLSPDRRTVGWTTSDNRLQVAAPDGTHVRTLATISGVAACAGGMNGGSWTGDSRRIVYVQPSTDNKTNTIEAVNADGSGSHQIATTTSVGACGLATSGDGRTVGYLGARKIILAKVDGSGQRTLNLRLPDGQVPNRLIALSRDGSRLLISTVSGQGGCGCSPAQRYYLVDAGSGRATRLSQDGTAPISGAFTSDGRAVLIDDLNRGDGTGVAPRLTLFGPDGSVLSHASLPAFEVGSIVSVVG